MLDVTRSQALRSLAALLDAPQERLRFLVAYGSRSDGADVDLFAVYNSAPRHAHLALGRLDIIAVDDRELSALLQHHDLRASEPLLTGELVAGDAGQWSQRRDAFLASPPKSESVVYLLQKSFEVTPYAQEYFRRFTASGSPLDFAASWQDLAFAAGYLVFAREYAAGRYPLTCEQAAQHVPLLAEFRAAAKAARRHTAPLSGDALLQAFDRLHHEMVITMLPLGAVVERKL